jgi:hypothetical protein
MVVWWFYLILEKSIVSIALIESIQR